MEEGEGTVREDGMNIEKLKELCEKAAKGPWTGHRMVHAETGEAMTPEDVGEYVKNSVLQSFKQSGTNDFLFVSCTKEDGDYDICHVGNGPTSPWNTAFIAAAREAVPSMIAELEALLRENADLKADIQKRKDYKYQEMLEWRGIETEMGDKPCQRCSGSGVAMYGSTTTWRGGIGGQAITSGICEKCWGSGNSEKPWADLRQVADDRKQLRDKHYRECEEIANAEVATIGRSRKLFPFPTIGAYEMAIIAAESISKKIARSREGK